MAQKLKKTLLSTFVTLSLLLAVPAAAYASIPGDGQTGSGSGSAAPSPSATEADCNSGSPSAATVNSCIKNDQIVVDLNDIVTILSAIVGIAVTGSIILGGVQYTMAGDSPDAISKAKQRITNGLLALVAFILTYGFLQWIIPGGAFS